MEKLYAFGWNSYKHHFKNLDIPNLDDIGRVISIKGFKYHLITSYGLLEAELLGRILTLENHEQPKVGDWVRFIKMDDAGYINEVLTRVNEFYRKSIGKETSKQTLATNIDRVVIVQGLDQNFNLMRLERYLVQSATCGIPAVVILNKSDLCEDQARVAAEVERLGRNTKCYFTSTKTGEGMDVLKSEVFVSGETSLLVGSSGVGKSSLINALMGAEKQATRETSDATKKGKHTTTSRDMLLLENGAIIIDTPGMRELGIGFEEGADFSEQFPVIDEYAHDCRFDNCTHTNEAGCAVIEALEEGKLDELVYNSYLKLIREQEHFQTSIHEKKKEGKRFGKMIKEAKAHRKRFKY